MKASLAAENTLHFWCPACEDVHGINYAPGRWTWNGSLDAPTIRPSVAVGGVQWAVGEPSHKPKHTKVTKAGAPILCHSYVTDGQIAFLDDCTHDLAGQTVDLPDWPYDY